MKSFIICFIILFSTGLGQDLMSDVDQLVEKRKYNSAFDLLDEADPNYEDPEITIRKYFLVKDYFAQSLMHQFFALKDLEEGEDLMEIRQNPSGIKLELVPFAVHEILDTLLKKHPENYDLHFALADFYYDVHLKYGNDWLMQDEEILEEMYKHFTIAAENGVSDYMSQYCLGYYHTLKSEYLEAITFFRKSIQQNPAYPTSHYNLSICYFYEDSTEQGIQEALKAYELYEFPQYRSDAARVAANIYRSKQAYEQALFYLQKADSLYPEDYYNLNLIVETHLFLGNQEEASKYADQFIALAPSNPRLCSDLMEIYEVTDHLDALPGIFERQIERYPGNQEALANFHFHLGNYYLIVEEEQKGKSELKTARKYFQEVFEPDHYVFGVIQELLEEKNE